LKPGQDLKQELEGFVAKNELKAAFIMTCVGSLKKAVLRLANSKDVS
jgi:predicted DNA-binding protein with PD1-like motif